jgi:hypothetical protein
MRPRRKRARPRSQNRTRRHKRSRLTRKRLYPRLKDKQQRHKFEPAPIRAGGAVEAEVDAAVDAVQYGQVEWPRQRRSQPHRAEVRFQQPSP